MLYLVQTGVSPVKSLGLSVKCQSIGPRETGVVDDCPVGTVHGCLLYTSHTAPVSEIHDSVTDTRMNDVDAVMLYNVHVVRENHFIMLIRLINLKCFHYV